MRGTSEILRGGCPPQLHRLFRRALAGASLAVPLAVGPALLPGGLSAQDGEEVGPRFTLAATAGVSFQGRRYERNPTPIPGDGRELQGRVEPTDGAVLGFEAAYRFRPNWAAAAGLTFSPLSYHLEIGPNGDTQNSNGGDQNFYRANVGVQYRVRPAAPGYFSGGVMATYVDPIQPLFPGVTPEGSEPEQTRTEFGAYLGLGLDFLGSSSRFLRTEGRIIGSSVGADDLERSGAAGGTYFAKGFALDYTWTLSAVFAF